MFSVRNIVIGIRRIQGANSAAKLGSRIGFDQIFNLYSPAVYRTGDIIDTMIYRMGIIDANFGVATAMGIFSSLVSLVFVSISYLLAYRLSGYRVF